jgi:putative transposase
MESFMTSKKSKSQFPKNQKFSAGNPMDRSKNGTGNGLQTGRIIPVGPVVNRPGRAIPEETRRYILYCLAAGRKPVDLAKEFGIHHTTIYDWRRKEAMPAPQALPASPPPVAAPAPQSPPRDTGRYSHAFKEEVLKQVHSGRKIIEVAQQYNIPDGTIQRWKKDTEEAGGKLPEPQSTRPVSSGTSPISAEHRKLVLELKAKHPNMGLAQVENQLKRFHAIKLGRHIIGRIFTEAGIPLQKRSSSEVDGDPAKNRFEMSRPNELWAVDFKEFWVHSEKVYALFILDDFSRFCLEFALTQNPTAELAIDTVKRAIQKHGRPERVLSDRGPQFHAWNGVSKFDEFLADFFTDHTVTKAGHCFTNGKIESFNRSIEAELLNVEEFSSLKEAEAKIRSYIQRYNFFRTHMGIGGLVPADRYFGMVEEAQRALLEGLKHAGPGLSWLKGLVSEDGQARRRPAVLQLVSRDDGKLELVVLGRRFTLG